MGAERIVIVGAGPAGLASARSYREHGGLGEVVLLGAESLAPYERPPLTKEHLRGERDAAELAIEPKSWFAEHDVDLRLGCPARAIDPALGTVGVEGDVLHADAIVLATGSEPLRPDLPGLDHPEVLTMRELADSRRIAERARAGTRALVLGTGFIGCELAGSLAMSGVSVTLIGQEPAPQRQRLGPEAAERIAGWLRDLGVELAMDVEACAVQDGRVVCLRDGSRLEGELVLLGMGVAPRGELAENAGLPVKDGAVLVDARMRVAGPGRVYAVGDVACAYNDSVGRRLRVEHWGDALGQGEVAGRVLAGEEDAGWREVPGFWSTIGERTIKYGAWGDGYDTSELVEHSDGAFTVWYVRDGALVGVLAHDRDEDYERGRELIREHASVQTAVATR